MASQIRGRTAILFPALPVFLLLFFSSSLAQEGVYEGETIFGQGTRISENVRYTRRNELFEGEEEVANPLDRSFTEFTTITGLHYGIRPELTASLLIPLIDRRATRGIGGTARAFHDRGLGDVSLLGKYRFYKKDWKKGSFNAALIGGLEAPTGDPDATDSGRELPPDLQLGSGSWDPVVAAGASMEDEPFKLDATLIYKEHTEGIENYERGDAFDAELKAGYRFYLAERYPGPAGKVRMGLRWRRESSDQQKGVEVPDSGSDRLFLRWQIIYHPTVSTDFSLSVQRPMYREVDGRQTGGGGVVSLTSGFRF